MKKQIIVGVMTMVLLVATAAYAATVFLAVTAPPYSEVANSAEIDSVSNLYLSIIPMSEINKPTTTVTVYEDGKEIWSGKANAVNNLKIASYTADYMHSYTLEIQESDGIWVVAQLAYD